MAGGDRTNANFEWNIRLRGSSIRLVKSSVLSGVQHYAVCPSLFPPLLIMLAKRIIPCLDVTGGRVVKGVNFTQLRDRSEPNSVN